MANSVAAARTVPCEPSELHELRHELGNAIAAVSAHAQILARRLPAGAETPERRALKAIQDGLLRASQLLRPPTATEFPPSRCDIQALVALAVSQVPPARTPDLVVTVRPGPPVIARGHPERIVQVLANLLDNAAKYSQPGTPIAVESYWLCDAATDWALIIVRDEGIGIDGDAIEAIFAGYRTAAACRTALGSGLGLQLSRRLIEAEGGQFWATDRPGAGSAFYLKLPLTSRQDD
jgi:signal transduction histidine kinase